MIKMKYKIIRQPDQMLCRVTCLGMICAYYGIDKISLSTIRNFAQTDREGNTINSLCIAADKLHMKAKGIKCTKNAILNKKVKLPIIVHTLIDGLYNHYMVLFEINQKKVILGDPAQGQIEMLWEEFEKIWTNKAILLEPTENFSENKKYKRNYKFLTNLIIKFKKQIIIMAIFTGIISGISMISTWFYSYLIDTILPDNKIKMLLVAILGVSGVFLLTVELNVMKEKFYIKFNKALDKELIINIYNRITNLPMSFFSMRTTGDVQARYQDGDNLRSVITDFSLDFLIDFFYAAWALVLILKISWQMLIVALLMQELMFFTQKIFQKKIMDQSKTLMKTATDVEAFVMATFDANETVKNYNSEKLMECRMAEKYKKYQDIKYKNEMDTQIESSVILTISSIGQIFMLGVLGIFVMDGSITIGNLVTAYMYINYIFTPIMTLTSMREQLAQAAALMTAMHIYGLSESELVDMIQAMSETGEELEFYRVSNKIADIHALGGISDKIILMLISIINSLGVPIAKVIGRELGMEDRLLSIPGYRLEDNVENLKNDILEQGMGILKSIKNLVPVEEKLYKLRHDIACDDNIELITTSLMSQKIALGFYDIFFEITYGKNAYVKTLSDAKLLSKYLVRIGKKTMRNVGCVVTSLNEPIGKCFGNILELREIYEYLSGNMPKEIEEIVLKFGTNILKISNICKDNIKNQKMIKEVISNGSALESFRTLIISKGGDISVLEKDIIAKNMLPVTLNLEGYIEEIDVNKLRTLAKYLNAIRSAPSDNLDVGSGIVFNKKVGDKVEIGGIVAYVYTNNDTKLEQAIEQTRNLFIISQNKIKLKPFVEFEVL